MTSPQLSSTPSIDHDLLARDIDERLLHLRGLILVRGILKDRGATQAEIDAHTTQIQQLRQQLARIFTPSGPHEGPTAQTRTPVSHRPQLVRPCHQAGQTTPTLNAA